MPRTIKHKVKGTIAKLKRCSNREETTIKKVNKTQYVIRKVGVAVRFLYLMRKNSAMK